MAIDDKSAMSKNELKRMIDDKRRKIDDEYRKAVEKIKRS